MYLNDRSLWMNPENHFTFVHLDVNLFYILCIFQCKANVNSIKRKRKVFLFDDLLESKMALILLK